MSGLIALEVRFAALVQAELDKDVSDPAHDFDHFRRVWALSQIIAKGEGWWDHLDQAALLAAAYFHDVINPPKDSPLRSIASRSSAHLARELLADEGLSEASLDCMAHAIEAHSFSAGIDAQSDEAKVLQDADRLEALGAIGLARVFAVSGALGHALFDAEDLRAERRSLDDHRFAVDHFEVKLLQLPKSMHTDMAKKMAEDRAQVLRDYLEVLQSELAVGKET